MRTSYLVFVVGLIIGIWAMRVSGDFEHTFWAFVGGFVVGLGSPATMKLLGME